MKQCSHCKQFKVLTEFVNDKHRPDGKYTMCTPCRKLRRAELRTNFRTALKVNHGLTVEQYDLMFEVQGGKCAICSIPLQIGKTHVDHNHVSGKIRGLLCGPCNMALGLFKDNEEICINAGAYLARHK